MNQDDNIKKFFEKRLEDTSPAEDLWNVPSDDIWNEAKKHFPKEKKRRPFIFFLFGMLTSLLILGSVYYSWSFMNPSENLAESTTASILNSNDPTSNNTKAETTTLETTTSTNNPKPESTTLPSTTNNLSNTKKSEKIKNVSSPILKTNKKQKTPHFKNDQNIRPLIVNNNQSLVEINNPIEKEENDKKTEATKTPILKEQELIKRNPKNINSLPSLLLGVEDNTEDDLPETNLIKIKSKRKLHRWEVGLSHSPFILNIKKALASDEDAQENEKVDFEFKYRNLNIPVSRWFNRKWSLTSGISMSSVDLDLDFEVESVYEMTAYDAEFRRLINDNTPSGQLTINDTSTDLDIVFTAGANLQDGDTLMVNGGVPIRLNVVQIPVLLNYHFGKGKLEGLIHTGFAVDFLNAKVNNVRFDVYKENQLISEELIFDPINEFEWGLSIYLGVGMKYYINDHFNIGLSTKIDFNGLAVSRHEIGVYYGF